MSSKDIENLLRERLGTTSGRPLPSPDFESRVRRSLTPQVRSRRRAHALEGLVAIAAVLALAVVMLPWLISPRAGVSGGGNTASPSTMIEPTPTPVPLAHAQKWFLSFDYPAAWTVTDRNITAATSGLNAGSLTPVSYTHLTLPTNREV